MFDFIWFVVLCPVIKTGLMVYPIWVIYLQDLLRREKGEILIHNGKPVLVNESIIRSMEGQ